MKKIQILFACLLIGTTVINTSCNKDKDDTTTVTPVNTGPSLSAKIDGKTYTAKTISHTDDGSTEHTFTTADGKGAGLSINIVDYDLSSSVYDLSNDATIVYSGNSQQLICVSGTLTITSKTATTISGTFSGTMMDFNTSDVVEMKNGKFSNMKYK